MAGDSAEHRFCGQEHPAGSGWGAETGLHCWTDGAQGCLLVGASERLGMVLQKASLPCEAGRVCHPAAHLSRGASEVVGCFCEQ